MTPTPTGRLFGDDLVLTRTFRASIVDVWASLTDPERTARWFGRWQGEAGPGRTIKVQMAQEEGAPWMDMTTADGVGEIGPGWEFYLDALAAARDDRPLPSFDDYYPALKEHFEAQR